MLYEARNRDREYLKKLLSDAGFIDNPFGNGMHIPLRRSKHRLMQPVPFQEDFPQYRMHAIFTGSGDVDIHYDCKKGSARQRKHRSLSEHKYVEEIIKRLKQIEKSYGKEKDSIVNP